MSRAGFGPMSHTVLSCNVKINMTFIDPHKNNPQNCVGAPATI